jgi:hypothetical protein
MLMTMLIARGGEVLVGNAILKVLTCIFTSSVGLASHGGTSGKDLDSKSTLFKCVSNGAQFASGSYL